MLFIKFGISEWVNKNLTIINIWEKLVNINLWFFNCSRFINLNDPESF